MGNRMSLKIMTTVAVAAVAVGVTGLVAGCGADQAIVHSQTARQVALRVANECSPEYRTLLTATEAYVAMTGELPGSEGDLVTSEMLREEIPDFDLVIADDDYEVIVSGRRCAAFDPNAPVVEPEPEPVSAVTNCDVDRRTIETAWEAYNADHGTPPVTEADLVPLYMRVAPLGFDLVGTEIIPVLGVCD